MKRLICKYGRFFLRTLLVIGFICFLYILTITFLTQSCEFRTVDPIHIKNAHTHAKSIKEAQCRPAFARQEMDRLFGSKYSMGLESFVKKKHLNEFSLYQFGPPFGFHKYFKELGDILELMTNEDFPTSLSSKDCKRCIVVGNGGILHGLQLGSAIDQYDVVIRLNNGPVHGYEQDVGHKTTIRMTYPEGAPDSDQEYLKNSLFVTILFKYEDLMWLQAILKNETVSFWNKIFFWTSVPNKLPLESHQIRILNPLLVKEIAFDILQFPPPRWKWFSINKNIPTIVAIAVVLATHLCDEVAVAGFGYDLTQPYIPLHYFDNLCMNAINFQPTHDISKEKKLLQTLVQEGVLKDLSGGLHCEFCSSQETKGISTTP